MEPHALRLETTLEANDLLWEERMAEPRKTGSATRARVPIGAGRPHPDAVRQPDRLKVPVGDLRLGPKEKRYLAEVIDSNRLSYGPFSQRFESLFAEQHDCKYAIFCNSGTSALNMALAALKERHVWQDGDEVLVPAVTFIATSNIVLHNRMTPVFVDVDPLTYNLDPARIEERITPRTRAIIPVH